MRPLQRVLIVFLFIVAATALVVVNGELAPNGTVLSHGALTLVAIILGMALGLSFRAAAVDAERGPIAPTAPVAETLPSPEAIPDERALLTFARQLLAATATEDLRAAVESQLPQMLNGRKVWIVWEHPPRPPAANQPFGNMQRPSLISQDVQEWTTFALAVDNQRLGLLGVESAGGLAPHVKQRIQSITPLLGQALKSAQVVDTFREASVVDLLTGAATRREGLNRLQAEIKRAQRTGSAMAVLMIDLDHFKSINDRFGHAVGDALLTAIGDTMSRTLRASDVRCRWGGEEFLILLPDTSLAQAQIVATHLLQNVAATAVPSPQGPVSSTASIGLTISRPAETDVQRVVGRADMALYQAKNAGRACVRVVLGGFDGEPIGMEVRKAPSRSASSEAVPFPDRRNPQQVDRRQMPSPGRRRTDGPKITDASSQSHSLNVPTVASAR